MRTHRRTLDKFLDIFHTRNMVKRPGLGKRKRVTLPPVEASEEPEQPEQPDELPATQASASDPGDTATQATQPEDTDDLEEATKDSQSQGRFKKKRLVRMTDGQEDEMAQEPSGNVQQGQEGVQGHGQEGGCLGHPGQGHGPGR